MLTFYTHPMSRGRMVRWMLEEIAQPYETVLLGYGTSMKSPDYLAINPMGKVPAIKHGAAIVTESFPGGSIVATYELTATVAAKDKAGTPLALAASFA